MCEAAAQLPKPNRRGTDMKGLTLPIAVILALLAQAYPATADTPLEAVIRSKSTKGNELLILEAASVKEQSAFLRKLDNTRSSTSGQSVFDYVVKNDLTIVRIISRSGKDSSVYALVKAPLYTSSTSRDENAESSDLETIERSGAKWLVAASPTKIKGLNKFKVTPLAVAQTSDATPMMKISPVANPDNSTVTFDQAKQLVRAAKRKR